MREAAAALIDEELARWNGELPAGAVADFVEDVRGDATRAVVEVVGPGPGTFEGFLRRIDRYHVNLLADRADLRGAPIVEESFPTRQNLAGSVERLQEGPSPGARTRAPSAAAASSGRTAASWWSRPSTCSRSRALGTSSSAR